MTLFSPPQPFPQPLKYITLMPILLISKWLKNMVKPVEWQFPRIFMMKFWEFQNQLNPMKAWMFAIVADTPLRTSKTYKLFRFLTILIKKTSRCLQLLSSSILSGSGIPPFFPVRFLCHGVAMHHFCCFGHFQHHNESGC